VIVKTAIKHAMADALSANMNITSASCQLGAYLQNTLSETLTPMINAVGATFCRRCCSNASLRVSGRADTDEADGTWAAFPFAPRLASFPEGLPAPSSLMSQISYGCMWVD